MNLAILGPFRVQKSRMVQKIGKNHNKFLKTDNFIKNKYFQSEFFSGHFGRGEVLNLWNPPGFMV